MKAYSIDVLRANMFEKLLDLGINPGYKENPSFSSIIGEFDHIISRMHITNKDHVKVEENDNTIHFNFLGVESYFDMTIAVNKDGDFSYFLQEDKRTWRANNTQEVKQEEITEGNIHLDRSGKISFVTSFAILDDLNCPPHQCYVTNSARYEEYNNKGIMMIKDYKLYNRNLQDYSIEDVPVLGILGNSREAFQEGSYAYNHYIYRELLSRSQFDTAKMHIEDKARDREFYSEVLLGGEYGYRKMIPLIGAYNYQVIPALSEEQILSKISKESNPKIAQALNEMSKDRYKYYYSSLDDPHFISKGFDFNHNEYETVRRSMR